ncbi:MAG: hypothetical protein FWF57_09245 [Defluviitaleaceae bacterium]|nr:hypothetical protein [Defluviitaleaceae bacterium]
MLNKLEIYITIISGAVISIITLLDTRPLNIGQILFRILIVCTVSYILGQILKWYIKKIIKPEEDENTENIKNTEISEDTSTKNLDNSSIINNVSNQNNIEQTEDYNDFTNDDYQDSFFDDNFSDNNFNDNTGNFDNTNND